MRHLGRLLILISSFWALAAPAAELFRTEQEKEAFLAALRRQDERYDASEKMIRRPFSSPGYHTTLKGGYVHPTRDSLGYAVALLDSGQRERLGRACEILRRVIALQDQDPNSRTYGIWSWFMEEPLEKMSPPDWNWADFCGAQLLAVALDHMERLPEQLQGQLRDSIIHAAYSIKRRNVGPGYTNIAIMGTYVTLVAGELFENAELFEYGKARLRRFYDYTFEKGSFSEYNSPTYTVVAVEEIARMARDVKDADAQKLISELNRFAWRHLARRFHPPSRQWSGPHSRCYRTLLGEGTLAFIQRATAGKVRFVDQTRAWESLNACRLRAECPAELFGYFTELNEPRLEVEVFNKGGAGSHDIVGTTYLTADYSLGSVNIGDLWNQRRPVLAYWQTEKGPAAMWIRCLHDGYDYSSASIFCVQDKADVLGAVVFATDRGDTHISLDRIKDATIRAKDLRVRLQFEGALDDLRLPEKFEVGRAAGFTSGALSACFQVPHAVFGRNSMTTEVGRNRREAWIDVVLFTREAEEQINFARMEEAAVVFTLSMAPSPLAPQSSPPTITLKNTNLTAQWKRPSDPDMLLTAPAKPTQTDNQRNAASAAIGAIEPWQN
jgi:hypothetical protein